MSRWSFTEDFQKIVDSEPTENYEEPARSENEILEEILSTTRTMDKRIRSLEGHERYSLEHKFNEKIISNNEEYFHNLVGMGLSPNEIIDFLESNNASEKKYIPKIKRTRSKNKKED